MNKKLKIKSLLFCCCLLLQYPFLHAQLFSQLSCGETWTRRSLTGEDIVVPQGANYLNIVLKGADGGDAWKGGTICNIPRAKGGGGAIVRATFEVGNGNDQLKPNGRLRIIVGQEGASQEVTCLVPVGLYAGGGGSSAILYLPPERLPIDDNDRWIVLAIAGGGGGGHVDFVGDTFSGGGGRASVNGGSSHVASGGAYLECPEIYQNAFGSPPGAGGGLRCLTNDQVTGNRMNALGFGFPNDNIEVVLSPNRPASSTGGTYEDWPAGGNGFTGGGCGRRGGGGGGGIAGGAAHSDYGGGGGGSYLTTYIRGTSGSIQAGTDGGGIKSRGFVNLTPQADPVTAIAKDISLTLDDTGAALIGPGDVGGDSFGGCGPITYTVNPNTFNCNDIGPNTVVFSMTDKFGNVSTASSVVTVEPPSIQVKTKNITRSLNSNGTVTISAADVDNGSSFSCGGLMDVSPKTFDCTQVGSNNVTLTITDAYGFSSSATATVEIIDEEPPVVQPIDVTVQLDQNGQASVAYDDIIASVSDNCGTPTINLYGTTFDCSDFGENTVVIEAIDANGNDALYLARVNVQSTQVKGKDITVTLDANGTASITGADVDDGSSTVCGEISSMSVTPNTFTCADIGPNNVLFMVSDGNGFSTVDYVTVTVLSNTTPQVKTKDITVPLDANGEATITASDVDDGSSVSCGSIASMTVSPNTFNCYDTGWPNTVTLTVTDTEGNVGTAEATVTVRDVTPPSYDCKDITVQLDASGKFTLSNEMFDEDGNIYNNDNCGFTLRDVYPYELSCADAGQTLEVSLRLEDLAGNRTICTANVTVEDNTAPTATTKDITVQLDGNGRASITGTDVNNGSSDACGIATLAVSPNSFDCSQVGDNTVTLTVTDLSGNVKEADATVTVLDNVAPVASCPSNYLSDTKNLSWTGESFVSSQGWQAFKIQNTGKLASIEVPLNTANPTPFPFPATPPTPITFKIYEGEGVSGTLLQTRTQMVILREQTRWVNLLVDPALTVLSGNKYTLTISTPISASARWRLGFNNPYPAARSNAMLGGDYVFRTYVRAYTPIPVQLDANGNTSITPQLVDAGSSDACGIADLELDQTSFDCSDVGENIVTLSVKDINGNTSSCKANIRVEDHTAPKALTQDIILQLDDNGEVSITPTDVDDGSEDNCGIASMSVSPNSFDCSQVGDNTVTLTVTDFSGNVKTAAATVTVEDKVAPTANCQNTTVQLDENGSASITTVDIDNGSSDACGLANLSLSQQSFGCAAVGTQTVTLTATDSNGNSSSCEATVTVVDEVQPTLTCPQDMVVNTDAGECGAYVSLPKAAPFDNCGIKNLRSRYRELGADGTPTGDWSTWAADQSGFFAVGLYQIQWRAKDDSNNKGYCSFQLAVKDEEAPEVVCKDLTVSFNGEATIDIPSAIIFNPDASFDACGTVSFLSQSSAAIDCDEVGQVVEIEVTGVDPNGNTSSCTAEVEVTGMPCGFTETGIDCEEGASATYNPEEESFTLTAEDCTGYPDGKVSFVGTTLCGDGEIIVHVDDINPNARAGVVMMESSDPGARLVGIVKDLSRRVRTEFRASTNGSIVARNKNRSGVEWLRIVRSGDKFKTYTSREGSYWRIAHSINFSNFAECIELGLITYAKNPNEDAVAVFRDLEIIGENNSYSQSSLPPVAMNGYSSSLPPSTSASLQVSPNPFQDEARIQLVLAQDATLNLAIYNLQGQLVHQFQDTYLESGAHTRTWDGTHQSGAKMPSGVYLIQLKIADQLIHKRVVLQQ